MYAAVYVKLDKVELLTTESFVDRLKYGSWRVRLLARWRVSVAGMATRVMLFMGVDAVIILSMTRGSPIIFKRRILLTYDKVSLVCVAGMMLCRSVPLLPHAYTHGTTSTERLSPSLSLSLTVAHAPTTHSKTSQQLNLMHAR